MDYELELIRIKKILQDRKESWKIKRDWEKKYRESVAYAEGVLLGLQIALNEISQIK